MFTIQTDLHYSVFLKLVGKPILKRTKCGSKRWSLLVVLVLELPQFSFSLKNSEVIECKVIRMFTKSCLGREGPLRFRVDLL